MIEFSFENLGSLCQANIELNDLTIICGKNNTGKTRLTHAIYAFLKMYKNMLDIDIPDNLIEESKKNGKVNIDLNDIYFSKIDEINDEIRDHFLIILPELLAANRDNFRDTKFDFKLLQQEKILASKFEEKLNYADENDFFITIKKEENTSIVEVSSIAKEFPTGLLEDYIVRQISKNIFPIPFILSTERTGAISFKSELNLAKNRIFKLAIEQDKKLAKISLSEVMKSLHNNVYPIPVEDNVEFINRLEHIEKKTSFIAEEHNYILELFEEIIGGTYKINNGDVQFITKTITKKNKKLRMSESSSSVRSLIMLGYFLKHQIQKNDILMIDEPELNLHPENQRKIARLLALLVNAGVKVFITTHSDYIIKELNTLIMLHQNTDSTKKIAKEFDYSDKAFLSPKKINLYMTEETKVQRTKKNRLKKAKIDTIYGIEAETFDKSIDEMNNIQEKLNDAIDENENSNRGHDL